MNEQFNKITIRPMNIVTLSPQFTQNSRLVPSQTSSCTPSAFQHATELFLKALRWSKTVGTQVFLQCRS
jgi:hypothetical protein